MKVRPQEILSGVGTENSCELYTGGCNVAYFKALGPAVLFDSTDLTT